MTNWWERPLVALDLETTGLDRYGGDSICRVTLIGVNGAGEVVGSGIDELVIPTTAMNPGALKSHGLTVEFLEQHGSPPNEVLPKVLDKIQTCIDRDFPICIFNALFDVPFLISAVRRSELGRAVPPFPVLDAWLIMRHIGQEWFSLNSTMLELFDEAQPKPHDSKWDATASARAIFELVARYPRLLEIPLDWIRQKQQVWAIKYVRDCANGEADQSYAWPRGKYANLEPDIQPGLFEQEPYSGES
jgi:DNA polymerase III epsilon subunit-like protein